eukprot:12411357-Alexandrium_andersonii.AAC.1
MLNKPFRDSRRRLGGSGMAPVDTQVALRLPFPVSVPRAALHVARLATTSLAVRAEVLIVDNHVFEVGRRA